MALIKIGSAYIKTEDIQVMTTPEKGTEEAKQFGIAVQTRFGKFFDYSEGRSERNRKAEKILELMNTPDENMVEIRRQIAAVSSRLNAMDRKLHRIQEALEKAEGEE